MGELTLLSKKAPFKYFASPMKAEGHWPIYKMHKYFARRPHNVFRALIEFYSKPNDIILDCFCGGGVSIVEGLAVGRKPIGCDLNPIAAFVTEGQLLDVDLDQYQHSMDRLTAELQKLTGDWFTTKCRKCSTAAPVRWFEAAFLVKCPHCSKTTSLSDLNKAKRDDKQVNGLYSCQSCKKTFTSADSKRVDYELLKVCYKCPTCGKQYSEPATQADKLKAHKLSFDFESYIARHKLWYPTTEIPTYWDRQREDCLQRKGFDRFADLFTKRNLLFTAHYLKLIKELKQDTSKELYKLLLFTFSATLRYTNSMTFSTPSWMGGRPVAWAKHAFWVPNQFVEVNPFEYIEKRVTAIISGIKARKNIIHKSKMASTYSDLADGVGTHIVWNRSSESLPIPDNSVALVVTDPPYGSNVQYGELTSFWSVWLEKELGLKKVFLENRQEVVVHRKVSKSPSYRKDFNDYCNGLSRVFKESHRVLRPNCPLVFTFNNKELPAWYAVMKAATEAGFHLDPAGVVFQEAIEIYRDTAHLHYAGALQGDFIYTFVKLAGKRSASPKLQDVAYKIRKEIIKAAEDLTEHNSSFKTNDLYVKALRRMIPLLAAATAELSLDEAVQKFGDISIEDTVMASGKFSCNNGVWKKK